MPWKCAQHGHEWEAQVSNRTNGNGCPFCSGRLAIPGETDLATLNPELAAQLKDLSLATSLTAGSTKKPVWVCVEGHEWEAQVNHRTNGNGCPVCSGRQVLPGYNDLATLNPEVAAQLKDLSLATSLTVSSDKKPVWVCVEGHEWEAKVNRRTSGHGCPVCADSGFNPGDAAWLYLARHPEWLLLQVGITNHPDRRLQKHASNGWEVLDIRGPMDGYLIQDWEASILRWLTSRNIPRAASGTEESPHFDTPNSGEAWQQSDLTVTSVREIMDLVEADGQ